MQSVMHILQSLGDLCTLENRMYHGDLVSHGQYLKASFKS